MNDEEQRSTAWTDYYTAVSGRPPAELLGATLARFGTATGLAIDLGCGAGQEAIELLRRGWEVLAIDNQPEALRWVRARTPAESQSRLTTRLASLEQVNLPPAELVWAGNSLPFCQPEHCDGLMNRIATALRPGGRFAGHFFGKRHAWGHHAQMTFHTRERILELLRSLDIEFLDEQESEQPTALQGLQHWHAFTVVARKP